MYLLVLRNKSTVLWFYFLLEVYELCTVCVRTYIYENINKNAIYKTYCNYKNMYGWFRYL